MPSIFQSLARLPALALLSLCTAAAAQPEAPLPVERFFQRPAVLEARLSPTGKYVAVTTSRGSNRVGLAVYDFGAGKAVRVAQFNDADVTSFAWAGNERLVFSMLDLAAGSGEDQREAPGLFAVNADGKELRQLVRRQGQPFVTDGSSRSRALDWNHALLHVPLQQEGVRPNEIVIGFHDGKSVTPMWLDTVTGRTRSLERFDAPPTAVRWMFDSKGAPRVAVAYKDGRSSLHWLAPGATSWRKLDEGPTSRLHYQPEAVDDAGTLYVRHIETRGGPAVLARFDFETMKPQPEPLVRTPGFDLRGDLIMDRAGSRALGVRVHVDAEQTVWYDPAMKQFQALVDEKFRGRVNRINCVRCGEADMIALVQSSMDRDPGALMVYEAATQRWSMIGQRLDGIEPRRMAEVELHRIKARDGRELPVWLTTPAEAKPGQALPAVVLVHGGPWVRDGFWRWDAMKQFLASRGYLVIAPEFRGSTGYGFAHYRAGWKQWGQAMQDDVADALLWAQDKGLAEKGRACIAGASYGGYSTLMGLARHPELYRCGAAWVAVTDLFLLLEGSWYVDDDTSSDSRRYSLPETIGDAVKDKAMISANSPVLQAAQIKAPLLLGFGEADRRVPLAHGKRLREALTQAGSPPEWVTYANEGHSWRMTATQIDWAQRLEKFLAQHLKTPAQ